MPQVLCLALESCIRSPYQDETRSTVVTWRSRYLFRIGRHGNLWEEEKRGFMRAITVQDFNPTLRIFVEAPTQRMRQRLVKVGRIVSQRPVFARRRTKNRFRYEAGPGGTFF